MRKLVLAILMAAAAETVALACTCIPIPTDAAERQSIATDVADGAVALVEVELVSPYASGRGERLRVVRTLAGSAPAAFEAERDRAPSSAACDVEFQPGQRVMVLLYPARQAGTSAGAEPRFRLADSCLTHLLSDEPFRAALVAAMARGERG